MESKATHYGDGKEVSERKHCVSFEAYIYGFEIKWKKLEERDYLIALGPAAGVNGRARIRLHDKVFDLLPQVEHEE